MTNSASFIINIIVAEGDPDGLRIVERLNWSGKAILFPRALYAKVRSRAEFKQPGVYLLLGPRTDGDGETFYIGEGDPVEDRFKDHFAKLDFWTRAVFFVDGPGHLNKAHVQYLEAQLISRAQSANPIRLENKNTPTEPTLSEADGIYIKGFLQNLLGILPVLSIYGFEQSPVVTIGSLFPALTCRGRGVTATGYDMPGGFVVQSGSFAASDEAPGLKEYSPNTCKLRADLLKSGVLIPESEKLRFTKEYTFNSPSMASDVVLGCSSNGRIVWKDAEGRTLKELQEALAKTA